VADTGDVPPSADEAGERRQRKSASAFRTISEVASELDIPAHVLRFWETKFNQVKPLKRGGGRRYYRPEDVELLRGIRDLLYSDGYTIKGVQKLLREGGVKSVAGAASTESREPAPAPAPVASAPVESASLDGQKRETIAAVLRELEDLRELLRA
jgi:DNA-binding transcriptional MerR regulator